MAVFGIPRVPRGRRAASRARRRRDARAARRRGRARLGVTLDVRVGVNTGEVVAGQRASRSRPATRSTSPRGSSRRRAPGEILLGADDAAARPRRRRGRAGRAAGAQGQGAAGAGVSPVARRPARARVRAPPRRAAGRARARAGRAARRVRRGGREQRLPVFTVVGPAGIGKSRLVRECSTGSPARRACVRGRCLSLRRRDHVLAAGRGARRARRARGRESSSGARARRRRLGPGAVSGRCASCSRRVARERPLVVVLDDLQWAEPMLLDLIEHVAVLSRTRRSCCCASPGRSWWRPIRSGRRVRAPPPCCSGRWRATSRRGCSTSSIPASTRRCASASSPPAEGNPLFLEETYAFVRESGEVGGAADDPGAARGAARAAARRPARRRRARRGRGQGVPPRRGRRARARPAARGHRLASRRARAQGAHPARAAGGPRRRRVRLPPRC